MFHGRGFTLIETTVAVGVFGVVILAIMGAFLISLQAQRSALAEKAVAENVNFALEFMSRQMRVAQRAQDASCITTGNTYEVTGGGTQISFINADDECITFSVVNSAITYETDVVSAVPITNNDLVNVSSLDFIAQGETDADSEQPRVTISIQAHGAGPSPEVQGVQLNVQTTVSARALDT